MCVCVGEGGYSRQNIGTETYIRGEGEGGGLVWLKKRECVKE